MHYINIDLFDYNSTFLQSKNLTQHTIAIVEALRIDK